ncbi:MAG TPA: class I SAM-dependent methyltransferase [Pirellulales bacterium]|nr:class I SAM-dependent methyltransferase [Pirellulales bacterium]
MGSLVRYSRLAYLAYFSQPASDRTIYRSIRKHRVRKILELGIGTGRRTMRMLETVDRGNVAGLACVTGPVSYTGIDLFEMRSSAQPPGLSLKLAHRQLRSTGAKVRLVPGDPFEALARSANEIGSCDLIVISSDQERASLAKAWFYFPRMLHAATQVFLEDCGEASEGTTFRPLPHAEINRLAAAATARRAA